MTAHADRTLLLVTHTTRLAYAEPVVEAHSEIRKTPVGTQRQRVLMHKLQVTPGARLKSYVDYFGTHVQYFNLLEPHSAVEIRSEAVVETRDDVRSAGLPGDAAHASREGLAEFVHWSPSVPPLPEYGEIRHRVGPDLPPGDFLLALRELGEVFARRFRYDPEATDVHSSPKVLFEAGGGVCQDLAHAMLGALRLAGTPGRYVSGYVYDPAGGDEGERVQGAAASHAWVEAWHSALGWVGIDPTNNKLVDWQYVRVAAGRDYSDVQPLRGVFVGSRQQQLDVAVRVTRIA